MVPALLALVSARAAAQVERVGPARVAADPGAAVTVAFRVRNPLPSPAGAGASLPRGWPSLSPDAASPLAPGESAVRLVATVVPRSAPAAGYVVRYRAGGSSDSVMIAVNARRAVEVAVDSSPRFAVTGTEYAAAFRVTNRGNGRAALRLATESTLGFAARADVRALDLAPGASGAVRVWVATKAIAGAATHRVTLRVAGDGIAAAAVARVPLVRRAARGSVGMRTLPATVSVRALQGGAGGGGVPGEIAAAGNVTPNTRVDLYYRGRGAAAPELGEQEQLSLTVQGPRGVARIGDQFWSLTPLTTPGRSGTGAGGRIGAGVLWAEGFTERNRFIPGAPHVSAGAVGVGGDAASLSANYAKTGDGSPAALSVRGRVAPLPGVGADAEYGTAGGARAAYARGYLHRGSWSAEARALNAGTAFPGDQRGRSLVQANGGGRLPLGLRAYAGYERDRRVDTLGIVVPGTELTSSTAHATLSLADRVTVERREETRAGVGVAGAFARKAESWIASASWRTRRVTLGGGAEAGTVDDRISTVSSSFSRAWVRAGVTSRLASLWAGVERRVGTSVETGREQDRVVGSMTAQLQPAEGTRVSLMAQAGAVEFSEIPDGIVDGTVEQRLPGGHTVRLRVRAFPWAQPGRRTPMVYLDYSIPLRLPIARDRAAGGVSGRVMDRETGRPVADVLVRVGDRAVLTDGEGRWGISGVLPGTYTVEIDPVSVGVDRVVVHPDALKVDVAGGHENTLEIGVSRAARVEGRVRVTDDDAGGGVGGAVIELAQGDDRRRRVTDAGGRFLFSGLAPGEWTVTVVSADLPENHALERTTMAVTVRPGEQAEVELRAVPRKRELVMVSGGDVVLGGPPARTTTPAPPPPVAVAPGLLSSPATRAQAPQHPAASRPATITAGDAAADGVPAARPELSPSARPWRERGESGLTDWANDTYVVRPGDESLTAIAWLVYRDGSLWPKLWVANRDVLLTPDRIAPGMELLVPPFAPLTADERAAAREWEQLHRASR